MHTRIRMTIDPRIPTMPGPSQVELGGGGGLFVSEIASYTSLECLGPFVFLGKLYAVSVDKRCREHRLVTPEEVAL